MFNARIIVRPNDVIGDVHRHLYGANLEHIGRTIYDGVWAEMLKDRKFAGHDKPYIGLSEGLNHQNPGFGIVTPWQAFNPDFQRVLYVHDNTTFYTGRQSQCIEIRQADGQLHGIQQGDLYIKAGMSYHCRLVLRGQGQAVTVTLDDQTWLIPHAADEWTTFTHTFTATHLNANAALTIAVNTGSLWIGCASLMPDHVDGFRADVITALRDLAPTFLRYPGGNFASGYDWRNGIGDRDLRPSYFDPAWKAWEPNDVGMIEFMALCRLVETEPILTINMGDGTVDEAAAWVEFCNGAADTPYGKLRTELDSAQPYNVTTWFVGNEQFGNWQVGHVDARTYARRYLEFSRAMRAASPVPLNLIAVGAPEDLYGHWNELVLQIAAPEMDELSVHYYSIRTEKWDVPPPADTLYLPKVASAHEVEQMLDRTLEIIAAYSNPPVPLAFDEWNTYVAGKAPDFFEDYDMADALYVGALMNACLRRADRIKMSAIFNLINVMGNFRVTPSRVWETPSSLVIKLLTKYRGSIAVQTSVESPTISTPAAGHLPAYDAVPLVDCAATLDRERSLLFLSVVNRHFAESAAIDLQGFTRSGDVALYIVSGDHPQALNTEADPQRVTIEHAAWTADQPSLIVRPHSFTLAVIPINL